MLPKAPRWGWHPEHPVVNVTWADAVAYSEWAGAELPTEAQWEYAARGPEGRTNPWGEEAPTPKRAVYGQSAGTAPVGSMPAGASWCGGLDLAGNVWEWCRDVYDGTYYMRSPQKDPLNDNNDCKQSRVLRGGSWNFVPDSLRAVCRAYGGRWNVSLGFRSVVCAPEDY